jgi:hypothetical protein
LPPKTLRNKLKSLNGSFLRVRPFTVYNFYMSLQLNFINTVFLTFIHNQDAIGYFIGILVSLVLLFYKPNRSAVFLLIGFICLLFGFEYNKHIIEPLEDQTIASLGIEGNSGLFAKGVGALFKKLLPLFFFTVGWGSVFGAIIAKTVCFGKSCKI